MNFVNSGFICYTPRMIACLNGKFLPKNKVLISAFDHGFLYGDAVFETLRADNGKLADVEQHMKRLQKSANFLGIKLEWPLSEIGKWAEETVKLNKFKTSRVRITVSRGENDFDFNSCKSPTLLIHCDELIIAPEIYGGIEAITMTLGRSMPEVKSTNLLPMIWAQRKVDKKKVGEVIMVDNDGFVREGVTANVFIVKNGVIHTPEHDVLAGVVRDKVIKLAQKDEMEIEKRDFKIEDLFEAEEIFLTNSVKLIVPVNKLNGKKVGNGGAGAVTKKLMEIYE